MLSPSHHIVPLQPDTKDAQISLVMRTNCYNAGSFHAFNKDERHEFNEGDVPL